MDMVSYSEHVPPTVSIILFVLAVAMALAATFMLVGRYQENLPRQERPLYPGASLIMSALAMLMWTASGWPDMSAKAIEQLADRIEHHPERRAALKEALADGSLDQAEYVGMFRAMDEEEDRKRAADATLDAVRPVEEAEGDRLETLVRRQDHLAPLYVRAMEDGRLERGEHDDIMRIAVGQAEPHAKDDGTTS